MKNIKRSYHILVIFIQLLMLIGLPIALFLIKQFWQPSVLFLLFAFMPGATISIVHINRIILIDNTNRLKQLFFISIGIMGWAILLFVLLFLFNPH